MDTLLLDTGFILNMGVPLDMKFLLVTEFVLDTVFDPGHEVHP